MLFNLKAKIKQGSEFSWRRHFWRMYLLKIFWHQQLGGKKGNSAVKASAFSQTWLGPCQGLFSMLLCLILASLTLASQKRQTKKVHLKTRFLKIKLFFLPFSAQIVLEVTPKHDTFSKCSSTNNIFEYREKESLVTKKKFFCILNNNRLKAEYSLQRAQNKTIYHYKWKRIDFFNGNGISQLM